MRPKVVIIFLVVAFALLGAVAVFKGVAGRQMGDTGATTGGAATITNGQATLSSSGSGSKPVMSEEQRLALISSEKEKVLELQSEVDGSNNPVILSALLDKVGNPEPEVRNAALEAIKEINDTNAIPGLQKAADSIQDPHGKVAVLDVIEYLNLPGISDGATPEDLTNRDVNPADIPKNIRMNPQFLPKNWGKNGQPGVSQSDSRAGQPQ